MSPTLLAVLAIVASVIGGAIALAVALSRIAARRHARRDANFLELAHHFAASVAEGGGFRMRGMIEGRGFHLEAVSTPKRPFAMIRAGMLVGSSIRLELYPQTSAVAASLLGDVETGDRQFDAAAIVRSDRPETAIAILDEGVRAGLLELALREKQFRLVVHEREALLEWDGDFASDKTSGRVESWLRLLARIAEGCERHH
jgi:hypothetical protein